MDTKEQQTSPSMPSAPSMPSMPSMPSASPLAAPHPFAGAAPTGAGPAMPEAFANLSLSSIAQYPNPLAISMPAPLAPVIVPRNNAPRTIKALCARELSGTKSSKEAIILRTNLADTLEAFKRLYRLTDEDVRQVILYAQLKGSDDYFRVDDGAWEALMEQEDLVKIWLAPRSSDAWAEWYKGSFST